MWLHIKFSVFLDLFQDILCFHDFLTIMMNLIFSEPKAAKVYCRWDSWTSFPCSASCNGGTRKKTRTKVITEVNTKCGGMDTMYEPCNPARCEDKYPLLVFSHNVSLCSSLEFCKLKNILFISFTSESSM